MPFLFARIAAAAYSRPIPLPAPVMAITRPLKFSWSVPALEYRAEKWEPVFRKKRCDNKSLEQAG